jgi:hypothetical protein
MDTQEAFTIMVTHLRQQGERSVNGATCAYRGRDGQKCAVGPLIPDELYNVALEGYGVHCVALARVLPVDVDVEMLGAMQVVHDRMAPEHWERGFADVAAAHELQLPACPRQDKINAVRAAKAAKRKP